MSTSKKHPPSPPKKTWVDPSVELVGTIDELVKGGGKAGSNVDGDPNNAGKTGVG